MIIHLHLLSVQQNKTSFEKLIQSIREREAGKKTLVLSDDENESEDSAKEAHVQNVVGRRVTKKTHRITGDEDEGMENEYKLNDPSSSMSSKVETNMISNTGGDMSHNENISETTFDVNYEGDTGDTVSPVLGKHTITDCSIKENKKCYETEPFQNLTPDLFERSLPLSCNKRCSPSLQQSWDSDAGSSQSFSLLPEQIKGKKHQCNTFSVETRVVH
jgi:hypothetical protein